MEVGLQVSGNRRLRMCGKRTRFLSLAIYLAIVVAGNGLHLLPGLGHSGFGGHALSEHVCAHSHAGTSEEPAQVAEAHDCQICKWLAQGQAAATSVD